MAATRSPCDGKEWCDSTPSSQEKHETVCSTCGYFSRMLPLCRNAEAQLQTPNGARVPLELPTNELLFLTHPFRTYPATYKKPTIGNAHVLVSAWEVANASC